MPGSELKRSASMLSVTRHTMQPMIDFFVKQLGFRVDTVAGKRPAFAMLCRDENAVMLSCRSAFPWPYKHWAIYFWVDNLDTLVLEF